MKRKAFTLVELLVVVAIIALLVSILLPALGTARHQAKLVVDSTRMRSVIMGALMAGQSHRDKLPKGGFNFDGTLYSGTTMKLNQDDAITIRAEELIKISNNLGGTKAIVETDASISPQRLNEITYGLMHSDAKLVFTCPFLETLEYNLPALGVQNLFRDETTATMPYIQNHGSAGWIARIGYCYLAGFDTESWSWDSILTAAPYSAKWRSPMTTADKGSLPMMTDRYRYLPKFGHLEVPHGGANSKSFGKSIASGLSPYEVMDEYRKLKSNIGYVDGSVKTYSISELNANHVTSENNNVWSYTGADYYFFK